MITAHEEQFRIDAGISESGKLGVCSLTRYEARFSDRLVCFERSPCRNDPFGVVGPTAVTNRSGMKDPK